MHEDLFRSFVRDHVDTTNVLDVYADDRFMAQNGTRLTEENLTVGDLFDPPEEYKEFCTGHEILYAKDMFEYWLFEVQNCIFGPPELVDAEAYELLNEFEKFLKENGQLVAPKGYRFCGAADEQEE